MMKTSTVITAALLASLMTACAKYPHGNDAQSAENIPCPTSEQTTPASTMGETLAPMPGSPSLAKGVVLLDQGRYASSYAAFQDAIDQGLPDAMERAQAYRNIGLLMCRLDSAEACQRNLEIAFFTDGPYEISNRNLELPHAQIAYEKAKQQFLNRCGPEIAAHPKTEVHKISLALIHPTKKNSEITRNATLLLRIKPWARVTIDHSMEITTPPTKTIRFRPGDRTVSIYYPDSDPITIKENFKTGQTWLLRQTY